MPREPNSECYREEVEALGISVTLKELEPGGNLYVEHRHFDRRFRKSLRTKDAEKARDWARRHCKEIALRKEGGALGAAARSSDLTLGELFDAFRERRLPRLKDSSSQIRFNHYHTTLELFESVWGRNLFVRHLAQHHIDRFQKLREEEGGITIRSPSGSPKSLEPVSRSTVRSDLQCLSSVFSWAQSQSHRGDRLIPGINPMDRIKWPAPKDDSAVKRPIADTDQFEATLEFAHMVGRTDQNMGRLYLSPLLRILRNTGRRFNEAINLRLDDVCFSHRQMRTALREANLPVDFADAWPFGAIHWRAEHSKRAYEMVVPMNEATNQAVNQHLSNGWKEGLKRCFGQQWRRFARRDESPALFPSPKSSHGEPIGYPAARRWLKAAEEEARNAGRDIPADLDQGGFHSYRRMWASERGGVFRREDLKKAVRMAAGWKPEGDTMMSVYHKISGEALYKAVAFDPAKQHSGELIPLRRVCDFLTRLAEQDRESDEEHLLRRLERLEPQERRTAVRRLLTGNQAGRS